MNMNVAIKRLRDSAIIPKYATPGSAAADLYADLAEPVTIEPGEWKVIPTGIAIAPEREDVVALIFSRSGMGAKHGISLANSVGVIDSDYRGEICVSLINHGKSAYTVQPHDRIAQLMFAPIYAAAFTESDSLDETLRGTGGFGSTGRN